MDRRAAFAGGRLRRSGRAGGGQRFCAGGATVSQQSGAPEQGVDGGYVFRAEVQEVTLRATVVDEHRRPVTTLDRKAFQVFEDGKPQPITFFRREDIPVALAVVIDNSGSMRDKRPSVNAAALEPGAGEQSAGPGVRDQFQ